MLYTQATPLQEQFYGVNSHKENVDVSQRFSHGRIAIITSVKDESCNVKPDAHVDEPLKKTRRHEVLDIVAKFHQGVRFEVFIPKTISHSHVIFLVDVNLAINLFQIYAIDAGYFVLRVRASLLILVGPV